MRVYYNDSDRFCCAWLRELIKAGEIPGGDVDERPIQEVRGSDLEGYEQVHLFAGIGGWAYALRLAGWPADEPVWTGSCPCQPYSQAGKGEGDDDPRNVWPEFRRLVAERRPSTVFGEQVAGKAGRLWLTGVRADLEALGYAVGAADLCAAGVAAPHIRQRLWWVADARRGVSRSRARPAEANPGSQRGPRGQGEPSGCGEARWLAQPGRMRQPEHPERDGQQEDDSPDRNPQGTHADGHGDDGGMDDPLGARLQERANEPADGREERPAPQRAGGDARGVDNARRERAATPEAPPEQGGDGADDGVPRPTGPWDSFDLVPCADGKARRVESGTFPLAHGVPGRVGRLRGYGNAITPQVAAEFIRAWREVT